MSEEYTKCHKHNTHNTNWTNDPLCCLVRVKRGGSRGFVLRDETVDEDFLKESLEAEQRWLGRFRQTQPPGLQRRDTNASSKYSFSTEYSSGEDFRVVLFSRTLSVSTSSEIFPLKGTVGHPCFTDGARRFYRFGFTPLICYAYASNSTGL